MRVEQFSGTRGSLKWIQRLPSRPATFYTALVEVGAMKAGAEFRWLSPLETDRWAEYRDGAFLEQIGRPDLSEALASFWPSRGPQWDGLAKDSTGAVYLIEAKAHLGELSSTCQASAPSREKIRRALEATKVHLGASPSADWLKGYYQYANRLAHLHFLISHGVDAKLVMLYFTHDSDVGGPSSADAWEKAIESVKVHLGLARDRTVGAVHNVYIDSRLLT